MRALNLDQLNAFVEVATRGSFSAAARGLHLTQPAVSFQIRELERRLGVPLVERVGRRAGPTGAGRALLMHAAEVRKAVERLEATLARHRGDETGSVAIGTGATACIYLLPDALRRLKARFPGLEIAVRTGNTREIVQAVEDNVLDLALVTLPAPGRAIVTHPVMKDEMMAFFPPPGPPRGPVAPAVIAAGPLLLYEPGGNSRRVIDDWFLRASLAPKPIMELGSIEAIKQLVAAGLGAAILPGLALSREAGRGTARRLAPRLYRELGLVLRRDKPLSPALRAVVDELLSLGRRARPISPRTP